MRRLLLATIFGSAAFAQVDTGAVSGVVSDSTGAVIRGARIQIVQESTNIHLDLTTNASGFYAAPALHPGQYDITATLEGLRAEKRTGIDLRVQDRLEINFQLQVRAASSEITVTAPAPLLESETSSPGHRMQQNTTTTPPLNRRTSIPP